jgi:alkanesulfonate monooxygenase SsuD/methylene tetrahydromethanopterin reductase-like flavin-dependent oxidoreductase (luciferase family)
LSLRLAPVPAPPVLAVVAAPAEAASLAAALAAVVLAAGSHLRAVYSPLGLSANAASTFLIQVRDKD